MQSVSLVDLLPKRTYLYYLRKKYLGLGFLKEHYLLLASLRDSMDEFSQEELLPPSSPKILKPWFAQVSTFLTPSTNNLMILFSGEATFLVHIVVHEKAKNQANHKTSYNCTEIPIRPEKDVSRWEGIENAWGQRFGMSPTSLAVILMRSYFGKMIPQDSVPC